MEKFFSLVLSISIPLSLLSFIMILSMRTFQEELFMKLLLTNRAMRIRALTAAILFIITLALLFFGPVADYSEIVILDILLCTVIWFAACMAWVMWRTFLVQVWSIIARTLKMKR